MREPSGQTLSEWNQLREADWEHMRRKLHHPEEYPNGITCDACGGALYDTGVVDSVSPTRLRVKCQQCNFRGTRFE